MPVLTFCAGVITDDYTRRDKMVWWCLASMIFTIAYTKLTPSSNIGATIASGFIMYQIMVGITFLMVLGFYRQIKKDSRPANQFITVSILPSLILAALFVYGLWSAANR